MATSKYIYPKDKKKLEEINGKFYLLSGNEPFLIEELVESLKSKYIKTGLKLKSLYGENLNSPSGLDTISGGGDLFAEDYLYVIREIEKINKKGIKKVAETMKNVVETSGSLYIFTTNDLRKVSTYIKKLDKIVQVVSYKMFTDQIKQWIKSKVREKKFDISQKAVDLIFKKLGNDLKIINGELEKLFIYQWDEKRIDCSSVEEMIVTSNVGLETIGRDITIGVLEKRKKEPLELFRKAVSSGSNCIMISAFISSQFKKILYARIVIDELRNSQLKRILKRYLQIKFKDDYRANMEKKDLRESFNRIIDDFPGYNFGVENGIKLFTETNSMIDSFAYATLYDEKLLLEKNSKLFELDFRMKSGLVDFETGIEEFILS